MPDRYGSDRDMHLRTYTVVTQNARLHRASRQFRPPKIRTSFMPVQIISSANRRGRQVPTRAKRAQRVDLLTAFLLVIFYSEYQARFIREGDSSGSHRLNKYSKVPARVTLNCDPWLTAARRNRGRTQKQAMQHRLCIINWRLPRLKRSV
jgi:hypothetical protein